MIKTKEIEGFGVTFNEVTLSGGVKLYAFIRKNAPISFRANFYAGSQFDNGKPGLAHFAEHIWLAGTEKYPTKSLLSERIQEIGGQRNAYTGKKVMALTLDIADAADLPDMFEVIDQILNKAIYDPKLIEIERGVVMAEQTKKKASPDQYISDLQSSLLLQGTVIENSVLGSEETITNATRDELFSYYEKYLKAGQVAYFLAGDFDLAYAVETLEKINGQRRPILFSEPLPIVTEKKDWVVKTNNPEQNYLCLGARLFPISSNLDKVASNICACVLGVGNTSRLNKILRNEKGYIYNIRANISNNAELAMITINTNCKPKNTTETIAIIKDEYKKLIADGITEKELNLVRRDLIRFQKFYSENTSSWVDDSTISNFTMNIEPLFRDEMIRLIKEITLDQVNNFIQNNLDDKELLLAGVGEF